MIAYSPAGTSAAITAAVIDTAMSRHPDGFGLAWRDASGKAPVLRTATFAPADRIAFRAQLSAVQQAGDEFAVHFRMATSGPKDAEQAHPFTYTDPAVGTVAVMHNGIINIQHDRAVESDTSAFVRMVLAKLPSKWWDNPALVYLVREAIGYSKLTIMTAHQTVIVGEEMGEWDGGLWYSSSHKSIVPSTWVPANPSQWGKPKPKPATAANPASKRSQKRAAKQAAAAARREARKPVPAAEVPGLRHAGHAVTALVDMPLGVDADYAGGVVCDSCQTVGDIYVIDGARYLDLAHYAAGMDAAVVMHGQADALDQLGF